MLQALPNNLPNEDQLASAGWRTDRNLLSERSAVQLILRHDFQHALVATIADVDCLGRKN